MCWLILNKIKWKFLWIIGTAFLFLDAWKSFFFSFFFFFLILGICCRYLTCGRLCWPLTGRRHCHWLIVIRQRLAQHRFQLEKWLWKFLNLFHILLILCWNFHGQSIVVKVKETREDAAHCLPLLVDDVLDWLDEEVLLELLLCCRRRCRGLVWLRREVATLMPRFTTSLPKKIKKYHHKVFLTHSCFLCHQQN